VLVQVGLLMQGVHDRVRVEKQLQDGIQQPSDRAQQPAVRVVEGAVLELVGRVDWRQRRVFRRTALAELIEQVRAQVLRIEKLLETHAGELADLLFGVVDAALVPDAPADLLHDLLDIDGVGTDVKIGHWKS
jgi:hypothetical protein